MLVGIGAAQREIHTPRFEARFLKEHFRQLRARLRTPGTCDEAQLLRLRADRGYYPRVLMAEVAALGKAAEIQQGAAFRGEQAGAGAAHDRGRIPVGLPAPAVQDGIAFGKHCEWIARRR